MRRRSARRNRPRRWQAVPAPVTTRCAASDCCAQPWEAAWMASRSPVGYRSRLGASLRDQAAETSLTPVIFGNRAFERGAVEVRPIGRYEHQLAVGDLPQQEIGQPLLAAGADDQIGIGQVRRIEILPDEVGGDR